MIEFLEKIHPGIPRRIRQIFLAARLISAAWTAAYSKWSGTNINFWLTRGEKEDGFPDL